jgi:hypothetical protein
MLATTMQVVLRYQLASATSNRVKKIFSVADAENLGITGEHLGETAAVAKAVIGGTPAAGNTVKITYTGILGTETVLDTDTLTTADAVSANTAAAALAAAINAGTQTHGFSATSATANLLVTTKSGEGIFPNSGTPYCINSYRWRCYNNMDTTNW